MMAINNNTLLLALSAVAVAFLFTQDRAGFEFSGFEQTTAWSPPKAARPYLDAIDQTEILNGIPEGLLVRLIYQESRYRPDIISGEVISPAGAVGIAQIVPYWHPGINPLDPIASIYYAGDYLRSLYDQFGSWGLALAAYNWGPGNLKNKGINAAPDETVRYVSEIVADVGDIA